MPREDVVRMAAELRLGLAEDGADDERLDMLRGRLAAQLRELDDVDVDRVASAAPEGTRAVDAMDVASLAVTVATSGIIPQVIGLVRRWLGSSAPAAAATAGADRTVTLTLDGDTLELTGASTAEQERLVQLFVLRHLRDPGQA